MDGFKQWEKYIREVFQTIEVANCQTVKEHAEKGKITFICEAPNCNKRLICSLCILSDVNHKNEHKNYIKRLELGADCLIQRSRDSFSNDMEMITHDASEKYISKLKNCSSIVIRSVDDLLQERLDIGRSSVEDHFNEKVKNPIRELAILSSQRMEQKMIKSMTQNKSNLKDILDDLFSFLNEKAGEDSFVWETAGKTIQRVKHQILYNKHIEENLKNDIDKLTRDYVLNLVETYKSYFFFDEKAIATKQKDADLSKNNTNIASIRNSCLQGKKSKQSPLKNSYQSPNSTVKPAYSKRKSSKAHQMSAGSSLISPTKKNTNIVKQNFVYSPNNISMNQAIIMTDKAKQENEASNPRYSKVELSASSIKHVIPYKQDEILIAKFDLEEIENKENFYIKNGDSYSPRRLGTVVQPIGDDLISLADCIDQSPSLQDESSLKKDHQSEELDSPEIKLKSSNKDAKSKEELPLSQNSQCFKRLNFSETSAKYVPQSSYRDSKKLCSLFGGLIHDLDWNDFSRCLKTEIIGDTISHEEVDSILQLLKTTLNVELNNAFSALSTISITFPRVSSLDLIILLKKVDNFKYLDSNLIRSSVIKGLQVEKTIRSDVLTHHRYLSDHGLDYYGFCKSLFLLGHHFSKNCKSYFMKIKLKLWKRVCTTSLTLFSIHLNLILTEIME
jgi:hypothetical protein